MKRTTFLITLIISMTFHVSGQIINVPSDYTTIQAAINASNHGDTIVVAEGTYYENINFSGKAITLASEFILDADRSHISNTIIDGSQPLNPDTASTVIFWSGEDTTSVLSGFTITGGSGTVNDEGWQWRGGGGILIFHCGAKILDNIIEDNIIAETEFTQIGCGLNMIVTGGHTAIVRDNIIRNNNSAGQGDKVGGGIAAIGGRILIEGNIIQDNVLSGNQSIGGGGIYWWAGYPDYRDSLIIEDFTISNNYITGNRCETSHNFCQGGGILFFAGYQEQPVKVYNNIISDNYSEKYAGGVLSNAKAEYFNNTIYDNKAGFETNSLLLHHSSVTVLVNNIIWSDADNGLNELDYVSPGMHNFTASHNLIRPDSISVDSRYKSTTYLHPVFETDSTFVPSTNCPSIGRGIDTVWLDNIRYVASGTDYMGMPRPDPVDGRVDIGAIESENAPVQFSTADLLLIDYPGGILDPEFSREQLEYTLRIPDTSVSSPKLVYIPEDPAAGIEYLAPADLDEFNSKEDSTVYIKVTSSDGTVNKTYEISLAKLNTDGRLKKLIPSGGSLSPGFQPEIFSYADTLFCGETETPELEIEAFDPLASVTIEPATDITGFNIEQRTSVVTVIPEAGEDFKERYEIVFNIDDKIPPELLLVDEPAHLCEVAWLISSQKGQIHLVPAGTESDFSKVVAASLLSENCLPDDTVNIVLPGSLDAGTYWFYSTNSCWNVSEHTEITLEAGPGPVLTVTEDQVQSGSVIEVKSSLDADIYLVYRQTTPDIDSIKSDPIQSHTAPADSLVTFETDALDTIEYALYAFNVCSGLSEMKTVKIVPSYIPESSSDLHIYPNPVKEFLYLETDRQLRSIEIYDILGSRFRLELHEGNKLDLRGLKAGLYILKISDAKGASYTLKVLKE